MRPLFQSTRTLSVHMYNLMTEGLYVDQARATAVVLLVLVIGINALSALAAKRLTRGRAKHEDQGGMNMEQTVITAPWGGQRWKSRT